MTGLPATYIVWGMAAVQILGLLSAWIARLSEGSRRQVLCQRLFMACLLLVGLAAVAVPQTGSGCWMVASATLPLMVLMATYDFGRSADSEASL
jgi:hypothetical protein